MPLRLFASILVLVLVNVWSPAPASDKRPADRSDYAARVLEDRPAAYWRFEAGSGKEIHSVTGELPPGRLVGEASLGHPGPTAPHYPLFAPSNGGLLVTGRGAVRVADPGDNSPFDFHQGDTITIEAWVHPHGLADDQQIYVLGKGRTNNEGFPRENQNYALRLRGVDGTARVSFLFRNHQNAGRDDYHRWNSERGLELDGRWHHIAVVYQFGDPASIRGYVDGEPTAGSWDYGGATTEPPVVDNDELWIGSALGRNPSSTFQGRLDEVALYRHAVPAERLRSRYEAVRIDPREAELAAAADLPRGVVQVEIREGSDAQRWTLHGGAPTTTYRTKHFAFVDVPHKYTDTGVIADRTNPFLLRARARWQVAPEQAGTYHVLLRAKSAARFYLDGELVAQTAMMSRNASGHEDVPELPEAARPDVRPLPPSCQEQLVTLELTPGEHILRLDALAGGNGLRSHIDELCVALAREGASFQLLSMAPRPIPVTEASWHGLRRQLLAELRDVNRAHRREAAGEWAAYWERRHAIARDVIAGQPPPAVPAAPEGYPVRNAIDHFIAAQLAAAGRPAAPATDDYAFLRRVTLDTVGVPPSRDEIDAFLAEPAGTRRRWVIDRLLQDDRWADHWVPYWQDVLAENPGILKPKLNNTGPFRWWIRESFEDNKPMDRFATELVMMEGSKYQGGPAGFGMATQNDAPLAAKAHVLTKAFLGVEMKCARCHDAPYHPFKQAQLFSLAALLAKEPIELPKTSTVPVAEGGREPLVEISLKPGTRIEPAWSLDVGDGPEIPDAWLRDPSDPREQFAGRLTAPTNPRFARVIVNRLWHRYLGRGLAEPVDDWHAEEHTVSHPQLLDYLARELVQHGYDLQHVARLILDSHTYQRAVTAGPQDAPRQFAAPARRRLTAEQLVDSLHAVSGKAMKAERLTLDPEGRRPVTTFLDLGRPRRAWEFTSLSNERDRPALALPAAQSVIDLLLTFGWRDARPHPVTARDDTSTVLQPLILANGIVGRRAVRLSDDSALTELCLQPLALDELIDQLYRQILTRPARDDERAMFAELLAAGYDQRIVPGAKRHVPPMRRNAVSWSNHLSAEATRIKLELERAVKKGDPPTRRLETDWRERAEDMVWALMNSPEFLFVP